MSNYVIELSVIHLVLMLAYWLFLRKETQYAPLRLYLIGSTLLALTIPLLKLPKLLFGSRDVVMAIWLEPIPLDVLTVSPTTGNSIWNYDLLTWVYAVISLFFLAKVFSGILYLIILERKSRCEKLDKLGLVIRRAPNIKGSFTFFNWIFLSDQLDQADPDYDIILKHEKAHASLGHTYDLMFLELFKVGFWWLPTTWFVLKEIKKIHEYQADACALKSCNIDQYSSVLISSMLKSNGLSLASSFHDGLISKRLKAMKQQAKKMSPWKFGLLGSLFVILFVIFACSEDAGRQSGESVSGTDAQSKGEIFTVVEELPKYPGGMDALFRYVTGEIKYPKDAISKGVEGRVNVQFVIEKDGSITDVRAIEGIGSGCDEEAVRVVQNASAFSPGIQRGKPVRVRMVMPIDFRLDKTNQNNTTQSSIVVEKAESNGGTLKVDAHFSNGEWSGTVYDPEGEVLPGVNIVLAGTTTGTVSNLDGTFKVKGDESNELYLSFVGYESVRLAGK